MLFKKKDEWARPLAEYDVIAALPDSVVAKPLGLVEEREPRGARERAAAKAAPAAATPPDLATLPTAALPARLEPQLATLAAAPPAGDWIDRDQVRRLPADGAHRRRQGEAHHAQRPRLDRARCQPLAAAIEALGVDSAWLDGEIVVMSDGRRARLQRPAERDRQRRRARRSTTSCSTCRSIDGRDLRKVPLRARRALLRELARGAAGRPRPLQPELRRARRRRCSRRRGRCGLEGHHPQARRCALRLAAGPRPG